MSGLAVAFCFLTRIPGRRAAEVEGDELRAASAWFPLVGAVVGLLVGGVYVLAYHFLPSLLAAVLAVSLGVVVTGGFHEDGLADTADAFGSGAAGARALEIMRDSRVGTFGAIAVVVSLLWRVIALASLGPALAVVALVVAHSLSRAGAVGLSALAPPARGEGLASSLASGATTPAMWLAVGGSLLVAGLLSGIWAAPAALLFGVAVWRLRVAALRKVGGVTGDVLGAAQQAGEMLALGVFAAASWRAAGLWWM